MNHTVALVVVVVCSAVILAGAVAWGRRNARVAAARQAAARAAHEARVADGFLGYNVTLWETVGPDGASWVAEVRRIGAGPLEGWRTGPWPSRDDCLATCRRWAERDRATRRSEERFQI